MTDQSRFDIGPLAWDDIDFGSDPMKGLLDDIPKVPPSVTNIEIQEFAREHFPEGPAAAIGPQNAWLAYQRSVEAEMAALHRKGQVFYESKEPMPAAAKRWDDFVRDWREHDFKHFNAYRLVAYVDFEEGINLSPQRQQEAARGSWRDRRPRPEKDRAPGLLRGRRGR